MAEVLGTVRYNPQKSKFELVVRGHVAAKSKHKDYFEYHLGRGDVPKLNELKITRVIYEGEPAVIVGTSDVADGSMLLAPAEPEFTIDEKFEMLEDLIGMTAKGSFKATLITGKGGVGKSFTVLKKLKDLGFEDYMKLIATEMPAAITPEDDEEEINSKVQALAALDQKKTYRVYKGYATASALYRLLYENRCANRVTIFDDCDSVLQKDEAISLLKGALDTYEERWISWNINTFGAGNDLPPCFKFEGQVIFVSNLAMEKVDEAVRTRCAKVDVSMTVEQRLERMQTVLAELMPDIAMSVKEEAFELVKQNANVAKDISFRSLMSVITICNDDTVKDKRKLARFMLTEN